MNVTCERRSAMPRAASELVRQSLSSAYLFCVLPHEKRHCLQFTHKFAVVFNVIFVSNPHCLDTNKPLQLLRGLPPPSSNETSSRRRRKRNVHDNFVETLVVADKTMVDAFDNKADLQSYIITLMGVVSNATSDSVIVCFTICYLGCHATL